MPAVLHKVENPLNAGLEMDVAEAFIHSPALLLPAAAAVSPQLRRSGIFIVTRVVRNPKPRRGGMLRQSCVRTWQVQADDAAPTGLGVL